MINLSKINKSIVFCLFLLLCTACTIKDTLNFADKSLGNIINNEKETKEKENKSIEPSPDINSEPLSVAQKKEIDAWLEKNGYNRYGDPGGIIYAGGTPLFNEKTGETMDRFEYILKKHPEILDVIK